MNVLIISQCEKRALTETRRVLDQFAERRGDRTWQTSITQAGLDTLRTMLKKSARKNTAVACHWIHGQNHSELAWIVGDASQFNEQGTVPTNTTGGDILRRKDENTWHSIEEIRLLAVMASLFHDFGKASRAFQAKLTSKKPVADAYRHEWVSLRLFEAFVGTDGDRAWLERLAAGSKMQVPMALQGLSRDDTSKPPSPFAQERLPALAQAIGWLVVSHHRLPTPQDGTFSSQSFGHLLSPVMPNWNGARQDASDEEKSACWEFPHGTPFDSRDWSDRAAKCAKEMLVRPGFLDRANEMLDDNYIMHLGRMALMLADHHYSSCDSESRYGDAGYSLYANTDRKTSALKQRLDEHLAGVASHARRVVRALPRMDHDLPRIARCKAFQKRTTVERFRWQDRAYDLAKSIREKASTEGFFGINMASTGCGKTLANGRILYGLADPRRGARFTVALGLRTLTLQTGEAYRERLGLGDDDMAVLVGGGATKELFELTKEATAERARNGSESAEDLLTLGNHVRFEGNLEDGPLKRWLGKDSHANKLVQAPVLVCTIDHLMPGTESLRGGSQIAPMLRLLSSDLVLDEPDDFDLDDLPALGRLVHWAGLLGSRVVLSSATLPPALIEALFEAYRAGRATFQKNRGIPGRSATVVCAWFDEFRCAQSSPTDMEAFRTEHGAFVEKRLARLREDTSRRSLHIIRPAIPSGETRDTVTQLLASELPGHMEQLHERHHTVDPKTQKRVSFGLVRFANIEPLIQVARALYQGAMAPDHALHLCVYHARHPLLMRSAIEAMLDRTLRREKEMLVFDDPVVRSALDHDRTSNHLFVVLASPVAEVGRDHDYDWAIVEPSSMRSIIQLAGRIRRHREGACASPNILVLNKNVLGISSPGTPAFCMPGFEQASGPFRLKSHDLEQILLPEQGTPLDAGSRICERPTLKPSENLVDLEHAAIRARLLGEGSKKSHFFARHWWTTRAPLTGVLQRAFRFRKSAGDESVYARLPLDEDAEDLAFFQRSEDTGQWTSASTQVRSVKLETGALVRPWGPSDYRSELMGLCEATGYSPRACAERFGTVSLREHAQGWEYHPILGFKKAK